MNTGESKTRKKNKGVTKTLRILKSKLSHVVSILYHFATGTKI